jgi:hypothetical protein
MIEELITKIFCTRNCAHQQHWLTGSYAEHSALGDFYTDVIDLLDNFVEVHQGNFGKIDSVDFDCECKPIIKHLESDVQWIDKNYKSLSGSVTALQNILDEIVALYLKTIYKLRFLK